MNRFFIACVVAALTLQFAATGKVAEPSDKPNVLMICIDDLNDWGRILGGHPEAATPHMDALASQGRNPEKVRHASFCNIRVREIGK